MDHTGGVSGTGGVDGTGGRGHAVREHTADVLIEAWAPTRAACLEEALAAWVETFAEPPAGTPRWDGAVHLHWEGTGADDDLLADLLEEAIARLDTEGLVVTAARLADRPDGSVAGELVAVPLEVVEVTGAAPKGVSRSGLELVREDGGWSARAIVDV